MNAISFIVALTAAILSVVVVAKDISYQLTAEEQLFAWVRSFGGRIDGITLMSPSDGPRGLFTTKDFGNESIIMVIPPEVMIHRGSALNREQNPAFADFFEKLNAHSPFPGDDCTLVSLFLMFEKFYNYHNTSISPYLNNLPSWTGNKEYFSFIPRFWNEDLRALFQTMESGKQQWNERSHNYNMAEIYVRSVLYPFMSDTFIIPNEDYLHEQFVWASTIVHTRAWGDLSDKRMENSRLPYKGPVGTCTVVPLADMLNHQSDAAALTGIVDVDPDTNETVTIGHGLQALQHLKAGDQIYDNYSPAGQSTLCNINLLLTFGFIDPDPEYDCFTFHMDVNFTGDNFGAEKLDLLRSFEIFPSKTGKYDFTFRGSTTKSAGKYFPDNFLTFQRVMSLSSLNDYNAGKQAAASNFEHNHRIVWSIENEYLASKRVKAILQRLSSSYTTSIEQDVVLETDLNKILALSDAEIQATRFGRETSRRQKVIVEARRREHMTLVAANTVLTERWAALLN